MKDIFGNEIHFFKGGPALYMDMRRNIKKSVLLILFFLFLPSISLAEIEFAGSKDISNWNIQNATVKLEDNAVTVTGHNVFKITSPTGLHIPYAPAIGIRLSSRKDTPLTLFIVSENDKGYSTKKMVRADDGWPGGKGDYRIFYIGDVFERNDFIDRFSLEFEGGNELSEKIESIRFYNPPFMDYMSEFWARDFITGQTIGFVTTPVLGPYSFLTVLYGIIIALAAVWFILARIFFGGSSPYLILTKALILSFMVAALLLAIRFDYNWLVIWKSDSKAFENKDVDGRIRVVHYNEFDDFFDFIAFIKAKIPANKAVQPFGVKEGLHTAMARYYLLPVKTSDKADLYWIYGGSDARFSFSGSTLMKDDAVFVSGVYPVAMYQGRGVLFAEVYKGD